MPGRRRLKIGKGVERIAGGEVGDNPKAGEEENGQAIDQQREEQAEQPLAEGTLLQGGDGLVTQPVGAAFADEPVRHHVHQFVGDGQIAIEFPDHGRMIVNWLTLAKVLDKQQACAIECTDNCTVCCDRGERDEHHPD